MLLRLLRATAPRADATLARCAQALLLPSLSTFSNPLWHTTIRQSSSNTSKPSDSINNNSSSGSTTSSTAEPTSPQANSNSTGSDSQQQRQGAYRRGFGAKVAVPSQDVLHEVLLRQPATLKLRAYHIGARIHISKVIARARQEGCRTNSGKDYCIIWLQPARHRFAAGSSSGSGSASESPFSSIWKLPDFTRTAVSEGVKSLTDKLQLQQLQTLQKKLLLQRNKQDDQQLGFPPVSKAQLEYLMRQLLKQELQQAQQVHLQQQQAKEVTQQAQQVQQHEQQQQDRDTTPFLQAVDPAFKVDLPRRRMSRPLLTRLPVPIAADQIEPLLVVYRYGSVVFAGTRLADEPGLIDECVPADVRYKAGGDSGWIPSDPMLQSRKPAEEHTVVVNPTAEAYAAKGTDQVLLRELDVGAVRVLTSVLAQSAALKYYELSVHAALEKLSHWRSRTRRAAHGRLMWLSPQQEGTLFKVIAASALVINEARQLLEMAEPAWDYASYHTIWALTADEFQLESRFKALEIKLRQVEKEAKHDVKDRAGRSYRRLEQGVVWLLVVSCVLAALQIGKKAHSNDNSSSSSTGEPGDEDAAVLLADSGAVVAETDDVAEVRQGGTTSKGVRGGGRLSRAGGCSDGGVSGAGAGDDIAISDTAAAAAAGRCDDEAALAIAAADAAADAGADGSSSSGDGVEFAGEAVDEASRDSRWGDRSSSNSSSDNAQLPLRRWWQLWGRSF